jgi:hypothetical protein
LIKGNFMTDATNLIGLAIDKNPVDFADAIDTLLRQKAADALADKKIELAQSIYGENPEENDLDDDDSDLDIADLDLDDIDLDLDDLDLETKDGTDEDA